MLIKWLLEERFIPNLGYFNRNDIYELSFPIAYQLIKQGCAVEVQQEPIIDDIREVE